MLMKENTVLETFRNYDWIRSKLPLNLFTKIKKECLSRPKKKMTSFLSGPGVAKHFYMEKNIDEFTKHLVNVIKVYRENCDYLKDFKILQQNVPLKYGKPWINYQKKHEFLPVHNHHGILSYLLWVDIPYDVTKEVKGPNPYASCFEFFYTNILGEIKSCKIQVGKQDEGTLLMFPSNLSHCVYPFYTSNGTRISIAGNVFL